MKSTTIHYILLSVVLLVHMRFASAQSSSDCVGALPFCTGPGQGQATVSPGDGNVSNETQLACVDNEGYSTWYTFTTTSAGYFRFVLNPVNQDDDYDWVLFNITGHTCADIPNDPSLIASCNSWGDNDNNGATGISTAMGGTGNQNGPGTTNGPPFNADYWVQAGETYVLMVSNWSESTQGFNIDVSASTAGGVYRSSEIENLNNQQLCLGQTPTIDIDFTGTAFGPVSYSWSPAELFVDPSAQDPVFIDPLDTTTRITLDFTNGVCDYRKSVTLYVSTMEYNKENLNQDVCVGVRNRLGIDFTGVLSPSGLSYNWSPAELLSSTTAANPYTVELTDTTQFYFELFNGPCYAYDSMTLFVHYDTVNASFDVLQQDDEETIPIEVGFTNTSFGNAYNEWTFGDGTSSNEENPPTHGYPGYDTYTVQLVVKSPSTFCVDTAEYVIVFPEVEYPNVITPNEDGHNDVLWITGLKPETQLTIYNRWGRLVFESDDYQHDWNADGLADGTYYLMFSREGEKPKKGWIQVLR